MAARAARRKLLSPTRGTTIVERGVPILLSDIGLSYLSRRALWCSTSFHFTWFSRWSQPRHLQKTDNNKRMDRCGTSAIVHKRRPNNIKHHQRVSLSLNPPPPRVCQQEPQRYDLSMDLFDLARCMVGEARVFFFRTRMFVCSP